MRELLTHPMVVGSSSTFLLSLWPIFSGNLCFLPAFLLLVFFLFWESLNVTICIQYGFFQCFSSHDLRRFWQIPHDFSKLVLRRLSGFKDGVNMECKSPDLWLVYFYHINKILSSDWLSSIPSPITTNSLGLKGTSSKGVYSGQ